MTEAEREKISSYEDAFEKIKEETGVNSMNVKNDNFEKIIFRYFSTFQNEFQEVVERYKGQGEKTERLEQDKNDAQEKIAKLKDEKENLMKKFEEMKYSGEQKMSEGQRYIEEYEDRLQREETRRDQARAKMEQTNKLLVQVKSDIEHLANKVQFLKAVTIIAAKHITKFQLLYSTLTLWIRQTKSHVASTVISNKSDEFVLDLLSITEEKLVKLFEDLEQQGMEEAKTQMKEDGFYFANALDAKLPPHNTRITISNKQERVFEDGDDSGDEGAEDFRGYRDQIKNASKQIVDSKSKRNAIKKKK